MVYLRKLRSHGFVSVFFFRHVFQEAIGAAGGIDLLLGAMQAHPKQANVQKNACAALDMLRVHATNKVYYFPLFFLTRLYLGLISMVQSKAFVCLLHTFSWQVAFVASKGACIASVTVALRNHPQQAELQKRGTQLVTFLNEIDADWVRHHLARGTK